MDLEEQRRQQVLRAVRALARASRILERSCGELSLAQYRVLAAISEGNERASRIAARLALGKPTISATVDSLTQRGLLTRATGEGDQRVVVLRLSPAGQHLLEHTEAAMAERIEELAERSPDGDALLDALAGLEQAIEQARSATQAGP